MRAGGSGLLASVLVTLSTLSACGHQCECAPPPRYDLTLVEDDSGTGGVSTGGGVGFVLDARRNRLTTSPHLNVTRDDSWQQFSGKHVWGVLAVGVGTLPSNTDGVFDVTASGGGLAPFTFHLAVGRLIRSPCYGTDCLEPDAVNAGDIVVQQWEAGCGQREPQPLAASDFELVQDAHTPTLQITQFASMRRAYRSLRAVQVPPPAPPANINVRDFGPCLPDDFPRYPTVRTPQASSNTSFTLSTSDTQALVFAFYKAHLDQLDWRVESTVGWTITFARRSNNGVRGTASVDSNGDVRVDFAIG